jgi:hypothetical protein
MAEAGIAATMVAAGGFASRLGPEPASESLRQGDVESHGQVHPSAKVINAIDVPEAASIGAAASVPSFRARRIERSPQTASRGPRLGAGSWLVSGRPDNFSFAPHGMGVPHVQHWLVTSRNPRESGLCVRNSLWHGSCE